MTGRVLPCVIVALVGLAPPAGAEPPPDRVRAIIEALYARHRDLAEGDEEARRALTRRIVEQIVYELPGQGWAWKRADPGRPPSKDCFARVEAAEPDGRIVRGVCYDWQDGVTRAPRWPPIEHDIAGQYVIWVEGVNHLAPPGPPPADLGAVIARLEAIEQRLSRLESAQIELSLQLDRVEAEVEATRAELADARQKAEAILAGQAKARKPSTLEWIVTAIATVASAIAAAR